MISPLWRTAALSDASVENLADTHQLPLRVARWACLYGLNEDTVSSWLNPETEPWTSPDQFFHMGRAVERIKQAVKTSERVVLVGDYDVDGVTAAVILGEALDLLHANWTCLLPHRVQDGYGLSESLVNQAHHEGARLIITVDNGIQTHDAIRHANALGIDVIVTDHHAPGDAWPPSFATIHWGISEDPDVAMRLSGAGVAWKVATALVPVSQAPESHVWWMGLAGIAALADMMPMVGENRRLVRAGLQEMKRIDRPGWLALIANAGVDLTHLTETEVLWHVTPRLNAAGRMDSANLAYQLLRARDAIEADRLANVLESLNARRRQETDAAWKQAMAAVNGSESAVVVDGPWHLGIVGIVAAKLAETYGRPAIVLADDGTELLKGSGRAPDGFPLHHALSQCTDWLHHFGGHDSAVGCAVTRDCLVAFRGNFHEVCASLDSVSTEDDPEPTLADDWLSLEEVNGKLLQWLDRFRPFGPDAPAPTFFLGPITLVSQTPFGSGQHCRLKVSEGKTTVELVWFRAEPMRLHVGETLAAVVTMDANVWRGRRQLQVRVRSLHRLGRVVTRETFAQVFRALRVGPATLETLMAHAQCATLTKDEVATILATFVELGFAEQVNSAYDVIKRPKPRDLRESLHYQQHLRASLTRP